jgi:nicotinamidase-related amidase
MLPLPEFYDPKKVGELFLERAGMVTEAGEAWAKRHGIAPASSDRFRVAAFGIDVQVGFCTPGASLFVPGAVEDTQRTLAWLYGNLAKLSGLHFSLDTHRVFQIFHPAWWVDAEGQHPAPFTPVTAAEVQAGKWKAVFEPEASAEYVKQLEARGKYILTIWPYHTLLGGLSHALVPAVAEAALFHAAARRQPTHFEIKGTAELTENYSVLSPEVTALGGKSVGCFNEELFRTLMAYDRVYVFGQAKSHCVLSTLNDLRDRIRATDLGLAKKVWILEDAMSPVPAPPLSPLPEPLNFPLLAEKAIQGFREFGMKVVKTTDAVEP